MGRPESKLGQSGVFLVLGKLGLKLAFFLAEFSLVGEAQEEFIECGIPFLLPLLEDILKILHFLLQARRFMMLCSAKTDQQRQGDDQKREYVEREQDYSPLSERTGPRWLR